MSKFVDFAELKERVSFASAIALLGLDMKKSGPNQWRSQCPACKGSGERSLVVTEQRGYFCFSAHAGGDVIAFVAHVRGCPTKDAAQFLAEKTNSSSTVPQAKPRNGDQKGGFEPLQYLEHEHDAVVAIGFNTDLCKELGIGYAGKGILRGTVAIPIRDEHGVLRGYVGATDLTLPPSFMANVVPFEKKKA